MPVLPSSLALTSIADGSNIVAADHRNNYSALQTAINTLLGELDDGAAGQVLKGVGTTISYDYPPGYEWDYKQITSNVNVTDTLEATATAIITSNSVTYDGSPVVAEFFCYAVATETGAAGNQLIVTLFEGATEIARLALVQIPANTAQMFIPVVGKFRFTPTAAAHTYKVCAFVTNTTGTPAISAGAGGTATNSPAFIRLTKV